MKPAHHQQPMPLKNVFSAALLLLSYMSLRTDYAFTESYQATRFTIQGLDVDVVQVSQSGQFVLAVPTDNIVGSRRYLVLDRTSGNVFEPTVSTSAQIVGIDNLGALYVTERTFSSFCSNAEPTVALKRVSLSQQTTTLFSGSSTLIFSQIFLTSNRVFIVAVSGSYKQTCHHLNPQCQFAPGGEGSLYAGSLLDSSLTLLSSSLETYLTMTELPDGNILALVLHPKKSALRVIGYRLELTTRFKRSIGMRQDSPLSWAHSIIRYS